jgi:adenine-specific DNA-methyltransferase
MEKITADNSLSKSADIIQQNLETLKFLFPTIVKEGKIDVTELQALLGEEVENDEEYYRFIWAGKSQARQEANKPSTGTLRPVKEESKDWDTTGNIFIEGDNLEVLKLMQKSYANKIKMIYIDPPYNTGKDFVYKDKYADNLGNYLSITGQTDEEGKKLTTNTESDGRYHSNWLNMMYPRLKLARNLLKDDGVIFISIDDNEVTNLRKLCDEIFGEENFVATFIWDGGRKNDSKKVSVGHEYILVFTKGLSVTLQENQEEYKDWRERKEGIDDIYSKYNLFAKQYNKDWVKVNKALQEWFKSLKDSHKSKSHEHYRYADAEGVYFASDLSGPDDGRKNRPRYEVLHPITKKPVTIPSRGWRWEQPRMLEEISKNRVHFGDDENSIPNAKIYLKENEFQAPSSVFYKDRRSASGNLKQLMGDKIFDFPKDVSVIKRLLNLVMNDNDIALDFFAGSGTLAEAIFELNSEKHLVSKFILIQLPESIIEGSKAYNAGYKAIPEIAKERIRRAGEKVRSELKEDLFAKERKSLDIGFRAFKLDSSNIKAWDGDVKNFQENLLSASENIKTDRTEEDVLYEILLKSGLDLSQPIEEKTIAGKKVCNIGVGALFICLANDINKAVAEGIGKWKQELEPATCRVIFKDTGFTDVEKTNSIQILKRYGIKEVNTI